MNNIDERLLEVLTNEPQTSGYLMSVTGIRTKSALREVVEDLRLSGYPVCSRTTEGGGYWLGNDADRAKTIASLKRRVLNQLAVIKALENDQIEGQISI